MKEVCQYCKKETDKPVKGFMPMTKIIPEFEKQIEERGREDWWKKIGEDVSKEEAKVLDKLSFYDQMLNTISRGICCRECWFEDNELYEKYYKK